MQLYAQCNLNCTLHYCMIKRAAINIIIISVPFTAQLVQPALFSCDWKKDKIYADN